MRNKVRIYTYYKEYELANRLTELYELFDIVDIKYSIGYSGSTIVYSALVIFREVIE